MFGRQERQTSMNIPRSLIKGKPWGRGCDPYETISILQSRNMLLIIEEGDVFVTPDQKKRRIIVSL